jgi:hypothetical protein
MVGLSRLRAKAVLTQRTSFIRVGLEVIEIAIPFFGDLGDMSYVVHLAKSRE